MSPGFLYVSAKLLYYKVVSALPITLEVANAKQSGKTC